MTIIDTAHGRVRKIDIVVLVAMAGTSGAAIILHSFGPVGMRYAVPAIVLPSMIVLAGIVFLGKRRPDRQSANEPHRNESANHGPSSPSGVDSFNSRISVPGVTIMPR